MEQSKRGGRGRGRKGKRGRGASTSVQNPQRPVSGNWAPQPARLAGPEGDVTLRKEEMLFTLSSTASKTGTLKSLKFDLASLRTEKALKFFAGMAGLYERVAWKQLRFSWRPFVGVTTSGAIAYAFSFGSKAPESRSDVLAHSPVADHQLYVRGSLTVPPSRIMAQKFCVLDAKPEDVDSSPGSFVVSAMHESSTNVQVLGEFWCTYQVHFSGTRAG